MDKRIDECKIFGIKILTGKNRCAMRKTASVTFILEVSCTNWPKMEHGPSWLEIAN
jgi:hypothetical protein